MPRRDRYRKRDSDRSGFTYKERELIKDKGFLVGPDEFDRPPPSNKSLGGEGELSVGDMRSPSGTLASTQTVREDIPLQYVTAGGGITYSRKIYNASGEVTNNAFVRIVGSNQTIDISASPQITPGSEGSQLTLECVGSDITLDDGDGLDLKSSFVMDSGSILSLFYNSSNNVWRETSRSHRNRLGVI